MRRKIPPFSAIRAFEAAARRMSISAAAKELCVSVSAVSQQIKVLEERLGTRLFERDPSRGLALTSSGRVCAPALQSILDSLSHVFAQIDAEQREQTVTLLVSPSLSSTWIASHINQFMGAHPGISVRLWVNRGLMPSDNPEEHDLAVYYGEGPFQDLRVDLLMAETVFPVCSPALQASRPIRKPGDLVHHTLLHDDTLLWDRDSLPFGFPDWSAWLAFAGVTGMDSVRGHRVQMSQIVLALAAEGVGVALARSCIALGDLARGRLIRPLDVEYPRRFNYYLVSNPLALGRHAVTLLRDWLLEAGRTTDREASGMF